MSDKKQKNAATATRIGGQPEPRPAHDEHEETPLEFEGNYGLPEGYSPKIDMGDGKGPQR